MTRFAAWLASLGRRSPDPTVKPPTKPQPPQLPRPDPPARPRRSLHDILPFIF